MDRQCIIASRLGNNGYSSNGSCTSQAAADPTQGAYGNPYLRYASPVAATDYYCNGGTLPSFRGNGDCGVLPYLSIGADGTPLLSPHHAVSDQYLMSRGGLTGLPKLPGGPLSTSAAASSSSVGKDLARGGVDSKESRVCGVCGDKALGYNFDAISCESCKAFFRRNAPKGLEHFKCAYDYMCKMDLSNRRFCKRCRLGKCFQIGMRREYILTDDERAVKRQKIIENRLKRGASVSQNGPASSVASSSSSSVESVSVSPPIPVAPSSSCATPPEVAGVTAPSLPAATTSSTTSTGGGSTSSTPVSPAGSSSAVCSASQVSSQTVALSADDAAAIDELVTAYRESLKVQTDLSASIDECTSSFDQLTVNNSASSFSDLVNIAEVSVRRVIAMAKQMRAFRAISHDDQIQLLKGGSIELLILRSVLTFDKDKLQFLDPLDPEETKAMKVEQLRHAEQGTGLFDDHMAFVRSLAFDMNVDETALILLLVIALFSPDRDRLTNRELVAAEQERYTVLLKRYLESILPQSAARNIFPKLLHKLADVRDLNEKHSLVLLKVNPVGIQPLMKEVLDIDH